MAKQISQDNRMQITTANQGKQRKASGYRNLSCSSATFFNLCFCKAGGDPAWAVQSWNEWMDLQEHTSLLSFSVQSMHETGLMQKVVSQSMKGKCFVCMCVHRTKKQEVWVYRYPECPGTLSGGNTFTRVQEATQWVDKVCYINWNGFCRAA